MTVLSLPGSSFQIVNNFSGKTPDTILLNANIRFHAMASRALSVMDTPGAIRNQLAKMGLSGFVHKLIYDRQGFTT
jgi:hypothetical protein